jgi:hypothetical protein
VLGILDRLAGRMTDAADKVRRARAVADGTSKARTA